MKVRLDFLGILHLKKFTMYFLKEKSRKQQAFKGCKCWSMKLLQSVLPTLSPKPLLLMISFILKLFFAFSFFVINTARKNKTKIALINNYSFITHFLVYKTPPVDQTNKQLDNSRRDSPKIPHTAPDTLTMSNHRASCRHPRKP